MSDISLNSSLSYILYINYLNTKLYSKLINKARLYSKYCRSSCQPNIQYSVILYSKIKNKFIKYKLEILFRKTQDISKIVLQITKLPILID